MAKLFSGVMSYFEGLTKESSFFKSKLTVKADDEEEEDLVDPQETLRSECTSSKCEKYQVKLNTCNERVNSRKKTEETCLEEIFDFVHCVDHCVAKTLFSKLK